jgi:hypothetical protein
MNIRWGWLKFMYIYTIVGAGGLGLGMIVLPEMIKSTFRWPIAEPMALGIVGSVYVAFGILSIFGLRAPLQFLPVLLLQLCYKSIMFIGVILPLLITGQFPGYVILIAVIFATYIIGDLIAIPFSYVFAKRSDQQIEIKPQIAS